MSEPTPTPAPAPTPAPTPTPAPAPTPTPTPAPVAFDWKGAGLDDAGQALVGTKGWKGVPDVVSSYVNLEKLIGAPPEKIIRLPNEMTAETMAPIYDQLGRPKEASGYNIAVPEGVDKAFAEQAKGWFHTAGLTASQAEKVAGEWNNHVTAAQKTQLDTYTADVATQTTALKTEWGTKYDENVGVAKQAAKTFGMTEAQVSAMEKTMGFAGVHKFLHSIGAKLGEAAFVEGGGKGTFQGMTPEMAQARISTLRKDSSFVARFNSKDPVQSGEARAEMDNLTKLAYPITA